MAIKWNDDFYKSEDFATITEKYEPSEEIKEMIADAVETYQIDITESLDPEENEVLLFTSWILYNLAKSPEGNTEEIFYDALEAFVEDELEKEYDESAEKTGETKPAPAEPPEVAPDTEIELKTSALTKFRFKSDPIFAKAYSDQVKKVVFSSELSENQLIDKSKVIQSVLNKNWCDWDDIYILGYTQEEIEKARELDLEAEDLKEAYKSGEKDISKIAKEKALIEAEKQKTKAMRIIEEAEKTAKDIAEGKPVAKGTNGMITAENMMYSGKKIFDEAYSKEKLKFQAVDKKKSE